MKIGFSVAFGFALMLVTTVSAAPAVFDVRKYGAAADGKTLDTPAFNSAIAACTSAGGGQVLVPPSRYLTGTIRLQSNITLLLEAGAEIVGTPDLEQYQGFIPPKGNPLARISPRWHRALILGVGVENVAIAGRGTINGNKVFDPRGEERMRGPHAVLFGNSKNISLRDISIIDAGNYAVMLEFTSQVEVRGIKVTGGWDGVHFRGWKDNPSRDVTITDCEFYTGDDAIAGWFWENTLIARCILNSSCNGIRLIGPARKLIIHDCLFFGPGRFEHRTSREKHRTNMLAGILLQPGAWDPTEGRLDEVEISNITLHDVTTPLSLTLTPGNSAGRIAVHQMTGTGIYRTAASIESWAETPVERFTMSGVDLEFTGGGTTEQAAMQVSRPRTDARVLPVWGIYARNVKTLDLRDVRLNLVADDARPAMMADDVERIGMDAVRFPTDSKPRLAFAGVRDLRLRDTGVELVTAQCVDLNATGDPITIAATVQNGGQEGLTKVHLTVGDQSQTRWVWMQANERKEVVFTGWKPEPGPHTAQCGDLKRPLRLPVVP